ncbi:uncharacterized protein PAC_02399 [Phialocephala subalpina]|uniref:Uncharacterized protein n=1 Tax=Phialocephala subalpina TaxID=576137 RepID=A0A1L7WIC2_9HELO|nr:uncharacterized protein PAC_02399 [Phialocephala subalpina]
MQFSALLIATFAALAAAVPQTDVVTRDGLLLTRNGESSECPNGCLGSGHNVVCCSCPGGTPGCYECSSGSDADCTPEVTERSIFGMI